MKDDRTARSITATRAGDEAGDKRTGATHVQHTRECGFDFSSILLAMTHTMAWHQMGEHKHGGQCGLKHKHWAADTCTALVFSVRGGKRRIHPECPRVVSARTLDCCCGAHTQIKSPPLWAHDNAWLGLTTTHTRLAGRFFTRCCCSVCVCHADTHTHTILPGCPS